MQSSTVLYNLYVAMFTVTVTDNNSYCSAVK